MTRANLEPFLKANNLAQVPERFWPATGRPRGLVRCWLSRHLMVQEYRHPSQPDITRLSFNRSTPKPRSAATPAELAAGSNAGPVWEEGITWDGLQAAKSSIGYGDRWAVEVFPADDHLVNGANMRHLWILHEAPAYAWGKGGGPLK